MLIFLAKGGFSLQAFWLQAFIQASSLQAFIQALAFLLSWLKLALVVNLIKDFFSGCSKRLQSIFLRVYSIQSINICYIIWCKIDFFVANLVTIFIFTILINFKLRNHIIISFFMPCLVAGRDRLASNPFHCKLHTVQF